jgi:hypothetical protein
MSHTSEKRIRSQNGKAGGDCSLNSKKRLQAETTRASTFSQSIVPTKTASESDSSYE